jgi:hypothetical protein
MIHVRFRFGPIVWTPDQPKRRPPASRASNLSALAVLGVIVLGFLLCAGIGAFL